MRLDPENLSDQKIAQVLAAANVASEKQYPAGRCQHKHHADHRFLHIGPAALGPRQQQSAQKRCDERRELHCDPFGLKAKAAREQDPASSNLGDRKVDEHDAAGEYLCTQRHVCGGHKQACDEGR